MGKLHTDHERGILAVRGFAGSSVAANPLVHFCCPDLRLVPIAGDCTFWRALRFPLERFVNLVRDRARSGTPHLEWTWLEDMEARIE
jgi:hypothetical protein